MYIWTEYEERPLYILKSWLQGASPIIELIEGSAPFIRTNWKEHTLNFL